MAIAIYKDLAKTTLLEETVFYSGDGSTTKFLGISPTFSAFLDGIKVTTFTCIDNFIIFDSPPGTGILISLVPEHSLDFHLPSDVTGNETVSIYIDTDQDIWLLSEDIVSNDVGSLEFSLDNISFYSCIEIVIGTDIQVYVKETLAAVVNEVVTLTKTRVVVVDSTTPLDSSGNITIDFTVPDGSTGGVEIHEDYL